MNVTPRSASVTPRSWSATPRSVNVAPGSPTSRPLSRRHPGLSRRHPGLRSPQLVAGSTIGSPGSRGRTKAHAPTPRGSRHARAMPRALPCRGSALGLCGNAPSRLSSIRSAPTARVSRPRRQRDTIVLAAAPSVSPSFAWNARLNSASERRWHRRMVGESRCREDQDRQPVRVGPHPPLEYPAQDHERPPSS